jgi:hypothetical protein
MKARVVVRILNVVDGPPVVMITVTGEGGRAREHASITEASGRRLLALCQKYSSDYSMYRDEYITQLKILLEEVR